MEILNPQSTIKIGSLSDDAGDREAAKQLRAELSMIKSRVLVSGTLMNSMLIVQLKMVLRGLMKKYQDAGLLVGENVTLVVGGRGRLAGFRFAYSQRLQQLIQEVENQALEALKKKAEDAAKPIKEETK